MRIAIIPCGFRCHTYKKIVEYIPNKLKKQISFGYYPFNMGFFTAESIKKIIENKIELNLKNTTPIIIKKNKLKNQIFFVRSTYKEINDFIKTYGKKENKTFRVLDSTNNYFTYAEDFDFILAHYNLFESNDCNKEEKLKAISNTLNRRRERMFNEIKKSYLVLLIYENEEKTEYITVDEKKYKLNDFENIKKTFKSLHKNVIICSAKEINKFIKSSFMLL